MPKKDLKRSVRKVQKDEKEVIGLKKILARMLKFFHKYLKFIFLATKLLKKLKMPS